MLRLQLAPPVLILLLILNLIIITLSAPISVCFFKVTTFNVNYFLGINSSLRSQTEFHSNIRLFSPKIAVNSHFKLSKNNFEHILMAPRRTQKSLGSLNKYLKVIKSFAIFFFYLHLIFQEEFQEIDLPTDEISEVDLARQFF